MKYALLLIGVLITLKSAFAQTPPLQLPVSCSLGHDCWIVNYVDSDPSGSASDFKCGPRTYNDHHGTDFAVIDQVKTEQGVDVLAAADGKVLRIRDGVIDKIATEEERKKLLETNKGCGNGVFIDHGSGWQSIYCHMKKGSITAKKNQQVKAGDKLGEIGYSGIAEFPHLHFEVFFEGNRLDPFTGTDNEKGCGKIKNPLWDKALDIEYEPVSIYAAGFETSVPDFERIKIDATGKDEASSQSDILTFWVSMFGVAENDLINVEIRDPEGKIFARREIEQEKDRARQFYFVGRKISDKKLKSGTYTGFVELKREDESDGQIISRNTKREIVIK